VCKLKELTSAKELTPIPEARSFYGVQIAVECIHNEMYSLMIDTFIDDAKEKKELFEAIETDDSIAGKAEFAMKYMDPITANFAERLLAFIVFEGVFFSSSFASIFWFGDSGRMPGLTLSNKFISRDEQLHASFGCMLYKKLEHSKLSEKKVHEMFKEAVKVESEFASDALKVDMLGMNKTLMKTYIEFVADYWLRELGYDTIWNRKNPFKFMDKIGVTLQTNFFEDRNSEYQKAIVDDDLFDDEENLEF